MLREDVSREIDEREREAAHRALREHFATGQLTVEALDARASLVEHAVTLGDLRRALATLPPLQAHALVPTERPQLRARLSSTNRAGAWTLPPSLDVVAHAGRVVIDLRHAQLTGDAEIRVRAVLSAVHFVVHADQRLHMMGRATLGSFAHLEQHGSVSGARHGLSIGGTALCSRVTVEVQQRPAHGLLAHLKSLLPRR
ncbi:MAG: DUF1707 SHOCT-like domain-containing protein [Myxococcota bacterium]